MRDETSKDGPARMRDGLTTMAESMHVCEHMRTQMGIVMFQ